MSSTIKAAIQALKGRISDAYTAISNKGGTLPATQDSANLPTAIASIPSGGTTGYWQNLEQYGVPESMAGKINTFLDVKLQSSLPLGTKKNVPFVMCSVANSARIFQGYSNVQYLYITSDVNPYIAFYQCSNLEYIVFAQDCYFFNISNFYLTFGNCSKLRAILGGRIVVPPNPADQNSMFQGCSSLEDAWIEYQGQSNFYVQQTILKAECLIYLLDKLVETTSSPTISIGSAGIARLNATAEGQAAIASAQAKGWTIA